MVAKLNASLGEIVLGRAALDGAPSALIVEVLYVVHVLCRDDDEC